MVVDRDSIVATADAPVKARRFSRKTLLLGAVILLAGLGGVKYGYDYWTVGRFIEETDDAYVGGNITVIAPQVEGLITAVAVTEKPTVHAVDMLVGSEETTTALQSLMRL